VCRWQSRRGRQATTMEIDLGERETINARWREVDVGFWGLGKVWAGFGRGAVTFGGGCGICFTNLCFLKIWGCLGYKDQLWPGYEMGHSIARLQGSVNRGPAPRLTRHQAIEPGDQNRSCRALPCARPVGIIELLLCGSSIVQTRLIIIVYKCWPI
jgi:hypothetical protein